MARDETRSFSEPVAHTAVSGDSIRLHGLLDHLTGTAQLAREFADKFGAGEWAELAGLWHDLGKYSEAFQRYLATSIADDPHVAETAGRVDHATAGAQHAVRRIDVLGHLLAHVIAGHHTGLLDSIAAGACLQARLQKPVEPVDAAPCSITDHAMPEPPSTIRSALERRRGMGDFSAAFFTRMLFSCLVDADFLDTEAFMAPDRSSLRPRWPENALDQMEEALDRHVVEIEQPISNGQAAKMSGDVAAARTRVRRDCLAAASERTGFFSLTVPTGGGKTLSSLAFALRHARLHDLDRIVYVVPFTTIIEQNADVFRSVFNPRRDLNEVVLEHHSNVDEGRETESSRLTAENWDAPLVVTTSVQFYESLFANRTSRCRKLHRLARAVVILDEVQTLPIDYLEPCLRVLEELVTYYGATVVLCTATQPAVTERAGFRPGLKEVHEIIRPDPSQLYGRLRRVSVTDLGPVDDAEIATRLLEHEQVLCIVNTRRHARLLYGAIGDLPGHYHLSALMCPCHRSQVIDEIRRVLSTGSTCRVVSTQLIEAGVDIDFPTVFRSLAGLDSIAQAAGRCNREGKRPKGETFVFHSEHTTSERFLVDTANCGRQVLELYDDPLALDAIEHFFRLYYWDQSDRWDAKQILGQFRIESDPELPFQFNFASASHDFRLIEASGAPVIVPWRDDGEALRLEVVARGHAPDRSLLRRLQRYTVQVPRRSWETHIGSRIELVHDRFPVLANPGLYYSEETGLDLGDETLEFLGI